MKHGLKHVTAGALAAAVVLALGAGSAPAAGKFEGVTLTVGTFGGSWKDRLCSVFCPKFEAEGGKVEWVSGNPRVLLSKLVAARGQDAPFDVVEIVDSTWPETLKAGFVQKYDPANIPNTKGLNSNMYDEYKVANWITEEGFIFDIKGFEELGIPRPTRFKDLLHPKLQGKVAFPDVIVNTAITGIVGFAVDGGGDENNIDPGLKLINDLNVHSFWSSGTQMTQLHKAGDVLASIAHAGWAVRLHDADVGVGVVHPIVKDRQGMASRGFAGVVAGTKNKEAAEFYINILVSEEMQELLHVKNGIVPTNTKIQEKYSDPSKLKRDISGEPFLLMKPEEIANLYYMDWSNFNMKDWTRKWNRTVAK